MKIDKALLGNLNNTVREFKLVAEAPVQAKKVKLKEKAIQLIRLLKENIIWNIRSRE